MVFDFELLLLLEFDELELLVPEPYELELYELELGELELEDELLPVVPFSVCAKTGASHSNAAPSASRRRHAAQRANTVIGL